MGQHGRPRSGHGHRALVREDAGIPIIAMTADVFSEDIQKCLECGMNDHLAKPIDVQAVAHKLKKYLGWRTWDRRQRGQDEKSGQAGPGISRGPLIGARRPTRAHPRPDF